jgi:hypothetical protein
VGPANRRKKMWFFWLVIAENVVLECACNISDSSLEDNLTEELLCSCCSLPRFPPPHDDTCKISPVLHQLGSVVGIATGYGLHGPGVESRWRRDFPHLSRPALGSIQLSCGLDTGSFPRVKSGRCVTLISHLVLVPWPRKSRAIPLLPLWAVRICTYNVTLCLSRKKYNETNNARKM